jgi:hypothetical protein
LGLFPHPAEFGSTGWLQPAKSGMISIDSAGVGSVRTTNLQSADLSSPSG